METLTKSLLLAGCMAALGAAVSSDDSQSRPVRLDDLTRRNLFRPLVTAPPPPKIVAPPPPVVPPPPKIPIAQKAARYHLVGIIPGDPAQAILEDAQTRSTIYVSAGQNLDDMVVEKVSRDRILLSSGDDRMDLQL